MNFTSAQFPEAPVLRPQVPRASAVHQRRGYAVAAERRALPGPAAGRGLLRNDCGGGKSPNSWDLQ